MTGTLSHPLFAHRPAADGLGPPTVTALSQPLVLLSAVFALVVGTAAVYRIRTNRPHRRSSRRDAGVLAAVSLLAASFVFPSLRPVGPVASMTGLLFGAFSGMDDSPTDLTYAPLFESTTDAVAVFEFGPGEPIVRRANEQFAETFGYETDELEDTPSSEITDVSSVDAERREQFLERARRGDSFETRIVRPTPHGEREFIVRVVPAEAREEATLSFVVLTDITEREKLETELSKFHDRISDAFFSLDETFRFQYVSDDAAELLERSKSALRGDVVWEVFPETVDSAFEEKYREAMERQEAVEFEGYYPSLDAWFRVQAYPSETGLSVYFRDVTENRERKPDLERSEARYRSITEDVLDASDVGMVVFDADGDVVWINEMATALFDLHRESTVGRGEQELLDDIGSQFSRPDRFRTLVTESAREDDTERFHCQLRSGPDGDPRWIEHWNQPIDTGLYEGGRIEHYADVTPRRKRRRALQRERDRFSALFNNTTDAAARLELVDGDPLVREINDVFAEAFDCDPTAVADAPLSTLPSTLSEALADLSPDPDPPVEHTTAVEVGDGDRRYLVRVVPTSGTDIDDVFVVLTDITKREQLAAARRARTRLTELLTTTTRMTNASNTAEAYDLLVDSLLDTYDYDAISLSVDGDLVRQRGASDPVRPDHIERARTRDAPQVASDVEGTTDRTWGRVVTVPIDDVGAVQVAKETTETFEQPSVSTVELVGAHLEETLQKLRKEQRLTRERESMEFLHRLLRHHLLNGLNLVQARLQLLTRTDEDVAENHYQTIERRIAEMIDRVQTIRALTEILTGDEDHELEPVELEPVVDKQVGAAREIYQLATIRVDGGIPDVAVRGDQLLGEVLDNLLTNAIQHNDAPDPEIRLSATRHDDVVALHVADNGPGIDDDRKEQIFEKGVTSLDTDDHGLGLYLVREVVEVYGGDIRVEDSELGGAEFVVSLPVADAD